MRIITASEIKPFGERQTGTQRQNRLQSRRLVMDWVHLNHQAVLCPIKPISISSRTVDKAIAITGGCYE
jgi:hypothetical protein